MGITKRPASNCSDEILPVEVDELVENTIYSSTNTDASDDSDYEMMMPNVTIVDYSTYYRNLCPELRISYNVEYDNPDADTKPASYKKKNISQMGRKKANRAQNENFLLSLSDEYEDDIFCNDNKNGFMKAINSLSTLPGLKESFIEGNDELVLPKRNKRSAAEMNTEKKPKRSIRPDLAFKNLTTSQKSLFKQKSLPFAAIDHLETEVVRYFSLVPNGIYTSAPLPSYNRILLHSIVRYYSLDAMSVNSRGRRTQKIVQVRNSRFDDFKPPHMSLLKYILSQNS
ncbi:R3H domain-containing protein 4-like [Metopolophium dirhodum]|uniref:R3H domain-containing protein 4-like n=1 Tax=Metopolophium dirhodum TaxID=44670 RepID=UPI00298F6242|nr:R3H domain-containing protein 4-like [Metopolophium dirhodum]XP_060858440.1 R3H domain-containing protein 4-like [Metopolophium dirhodum]XP_060858441.1 R3H domain-containing protein 4-like [Metopolophium dirhodum]XP_060858442.1 R3H domain-containing protein 4-like [Metopolophium dirhodum]